MKQETSNAVVAPGVPGVPAKEVNHTFVTEGLTNVEINFLKVVEKLFFEGVTISFQDMMLKAFNICGYKKGSEESKQCLNAWEYWTFLKRPAYRESYKTPLKLSTLLKPGAKFWLSGYKGRFDYVGKDLNMLSGLSTYFKIVNDCLYCEYNQIICSRFVAVIENDLIN